MRRAEPGGLGIAAIFLVVAVGVLVRPLWEASVPEGLLVEVSGEVAAPGLYVVDPPTLAAAVEAAGGLSRDVPETPLRPGDAVMVAPEGPRVVRAEQPLLHALPVDVNLDGEAALAAVPGLGTRGARALVEARARGPLRDAEAVRRAAGKAAEVAGAALTVGDIGPEPPVDVNTAGVDALVGLPGIGPATAQRIVDDRATRGPFATLDDLMRVRGVGPATVERLRDRAVAGTP